MQLLSIQRFQRGENPLMVVTNFSFWVHIVAKIKTRQCTVCQSSVNTNGKSLVVRKGHEGVLGEWKYRSTHWPRH
jgi:hypothetical protein